MYSITMMGGNKTFCVCGVVQLSIYTIVVIAEQLWMCQEMDKIEEIQFI